MSAMIFLPIIHERAPGTEDVRLMEEEDEDGERDQPTGGTAEEGTERVSSRDVRSEDMDVCDEGVGEGVSM